MRIKALLSISSFFIIPGLLGMIITKTNFISLDNYLVVSLLVYLLTIIFISLLNYSYLKEKLSANLQASNRPIINGIKGYFLVILFNIFLTIFLVYTNSELVTPENQQDVETIVGNSPLILSFIVIGIAGPICEELVFRFSIFALLIKDQKTNRFLPYLIAAIIFSLLHDQSIITSFSMTSLTMFLTYLAPSLALSIVYQRTNHNLVAVTITHILVNTVSIIMLGVVN